MLKKKYIKRVYINVPYCDKCGAELRPTGTYLTSYPAKYSYVCSNPECDGVETFWEYELPGKIEYEFEEEEDV